MIAQRIAQYNVGLFKVPVLLIDIEVSSYLLEVSRYIHRNPVETKKPLVPKLEDYSWSSYRSYRNISRTPEWLYKESIFEELGSGQPTAAYGRFVEQGIDEETENFYSKDRWPAVRGSAGFVDKAHLHALSESREVKKSKAVIPFNSVVRTISQYYECSVSEIVHSKRGRQERNTARWMAMKLSQEHTEMTLLELAEKFHVGSYGAISTTVGKLNELLAIDKELLEHYDELSGLIVEFET